MQDATKGWKLGPMDLESRGGWAEYSRAKDEMFAVTDIKQASWRVNPELEAMPGSSVTSRPFSANSAVRRFSAA